MPRHHGHHHHHHHHHHRCRRQDDSVVPIVVGAIAVVGTRLVKAYVDAQNQHSADNPSYGLPTPHYNSPAIQYSSSKISEICALCHEDIKASEGKCLKCTHTFHARCINAWLRATGVCPECKNRGI